MAAGDEKAKEKAGAKSEDAKKALAERWKDVESAMAKAKEATGEGWVTARDAVMNAIEAFKAELAKHE